MEWGRLGNQLFQLGMLFAVQQRHGYGFWLPHDGETVWDCFDLDVAACGPVPTARFDEVHGSCNFDGRVFDQPDGTAYHGYFQSYRYFDGCEKELIEFLRFAPRYRAARSALLLAYRRRHQRPLVSVHVRRGDYLRHDAVDWGDLYTDGYYDRAAGCVGDGVAYLVFSDDMAWCRQNVALEPAEFVDVDDCTALAVMTGCDVNVVANSSFSWWGAFLNPGSDVYAPKPWWRDVGPPNDRQDDVVPPAWRTVPTFA